MNRRLLDIHKLLQQRAGEGGSDLENLVSGSSTDTAPPKQTQENGGEQGELIGIKFMDMLGADFLLPFLEYGFCCSNKHYLILS